MKPQKLAKALGPFLFTAGITGYAVRYSSLNKSEDNYGIDSNGNSFKSINDFWKNRADKQWYKKQEKYWDDQPTTVEGVLGGYGSTS